VERGTLKEIDQASEGHSPTGECKRRNRSGQQQFYKEARGTHFLNSVGQTSENNKSKQESDGCSLPKECRGGTSQKGKKKVTDQGH